MSNQFFQYPLNPHTHKKFDHLATLDPAQADGLVKTVQNVVKFCDPINVILTDSVLSHWFHDGAGLLQVDLNALLPQNLTLGLINHQDLAKSLTVLNNGANLTISLDSENQAYRFVAGTSELNVPTAFMDQSEIPRVTIVDAVEVGTAITIKDTTQLKIKDSKGPVRLYVYANELASVELPAGAIHHFSKLSLCENRSDANLTFLSYSFLRFAGKVATLKVFRNDDEYRLLTESPIGVGIQARVYEPLFIDG